LKTKFTYIFTYYIKLNFSKVLTNFYTTEDEKIEKDWFLAILGVLSKVSYTL